MELATAYYDPANPGSYGGINRLKAATGKDPREWLAGQDTYTLYKPRRVKYQTRRYIVSGIDDLWQADLADLSKLAEWNDGFKYVLVVIDVFSKFVWVQFLKAKGANDVLAGIKMILMSQERKPNNFMTDKGKEFDNNQLKQYFEENEINFYTSQNPDTKAAVAERVIRTLKGRLYRYFRKNKTWKYLTVLPKLVRSYNHTKHRSIGTYPANVTKQTEAEVRRKLFPTKHVKAPKFKFHVGDKVRLAKERNVFDKGYKQLWTEEIFTVCKQKPTYPPVYKLKDYNNEVIVGSFYEPELQKVEESQVYTVDKVLKTRISNGKKDYFVSWRGYPSSMNSWITDIIHHAN